jgi:O-antigen biosynthesis protein
LSRKDTEVKSLSNTSSGNDSFEQSNKISKSKHDIGIVIVNYNVRHFLMHCLQSIRNAQLQGIHIDVWVVDNASVDGSVSLLRSEYPEVNLIANDKNVGFSAANNQAIRLIDAKYILLLNPDTVLEEDTLVKCYAFMEAHADAGAMGVRMIDGAGKFLPESKRKIPDVWNSFCKLTYLSELFPKSRLFSGYNLGYLPEDQTNEVEVLCGAFMFIRKEVLDTTGLLDEAFFMYGEDIDLSYRILKAGYKIWYFPETSIIHYKGESTKKSSLNYVRTFYGAMHIYVNKHYGKGNADFFARVINIAISLRALLSGISRVLMSWILPIVDMFLIWYFLDIIKDAWADYYFHDVTYYRNTSMDKILPVYAIIWVFFLWLGGHYDALRNRWNTLMHIGSGTIFILIGYALLPENMRSSRAIILFGSVVAFILTWLTSWAYKSIFQTNHPTPKENNVAIVAKKENALKLTQILKNAQYNEDNFHYIYPGENPNDSWYTNTIAGLPSIAKTLGINEVIYASDDITMKEIIRSMTLLESKVTFKIGGDDSLSIIGSNSKNQQGELISLDVHYKLSSPQTKRYKRLLDMLISVLFIPLIPVLLVVTGFKFNVISNIFKVLMAKATWVGYGGLQVDYGFLPELPAAVIKYPLSEKLLSYTEDHFKKRNIDYAKEYSIFLDMKALLSNLFKVGNDDR